MIVEALLYLLTPCPCWARKAGYLTESISIGARHSRVAQSWQPHLVHSRRAVLNAVGHLRDVRDQTEQSGTLLIAGSGHGFDLPLEELAQHFDEVTLIDCVHPLRMRLRAFFAGRPAWIRTARIRTARIRTARIRTARIRLVHADVTAAHGPDFTETNFDLAISLNLISQLGLAPGARGVKGDENIEELKLAHLDWMRARSKQAWVIGDAYRVSGDGQSPAVPDALLHSKAEESWLWTLAPDGEQRVAGKLETEVRVWKL